MRAKLRFLTALVVHLLGVAMNGMTLVILAALGAFKFLVPLAGVWLLNGVLCAVVAWRRQDSWPEALRRLPRPLRLAFCYIVYGVFQWLQVEHIWSCYKLRRARVNSACPGCPRTPTHGPRMREPLLDEPGRLELGCVVEKPEGEERKSSFNDDSWPEAQPTPAQPDGRPQQPQSATNELQPQELPHLFHSKTIDGVVVCFPFALFSLYAAFLLDGSAIECHWHMTQSLFKHRWVRGYLLCSGLLSVFSLTLGILEIDYRISAEVRRRVEQSQRFTAVHCLFRASEALSRLMIVIVMCLFLRPLRIFDSIFGPYILCVPIFVLYLLYVGILRTARPRGDPPDSLAGHLLVALATLVVNPTRFVDTAGFMSASRRADLRIQALRIVEFLLVLFLVYKVWDTKLPPSCNTAAHPEVPPTIGDYFWKYQRNALFLIVVAHLVQLVTFCAHQVPRRAAMARRSDGAVLTLIAAGGASPRAHNDEVRASIGLSAFLLQIGTGISNSLFSTVDQPPRLAWDFVIEKRLGAGSFGVVVQVRQHSSQGTLLPQELHRRFALKFLSAVPSEWREADTLSIVSHPFIVRLVHFFEVRQQRWHYEANGEVVEDENGEQTFQRAILMELCHQGDLEGHLRKKWLWHRGDPTRLNELRNQLMQEPTCVAQQRHLAESRILSAEVGEALKFLHSKRIVYRDLKPDNVLLKEGIAWEVHACLTDFGFSKRLSVTNPPRSTAGNPLTAAPEVPRPGQPHRAYNHRADVYSFGQFLLVVLWRSYQKDGRFKDLLVPPKECWEDGSDPRVPKEAAELILKATQQHPKARGEMQELLQHPFFSSRIKHFGASYAPLSLSVLMADAEAQREAAFPSHEDGAHG